MSFPTGWGRKVKITVPDAKITGSNTDFPILLTKDNLPTEMVDAGSNSALNGGGDVRFSEDAAGTTQLDLDVVTFVTNASEPSREVELHVKRPTLNTGAARDIYAWYKKAGEVQPAVTASFGRNAVWTDYLVVAHLKEAANNDAGGYTNSTGGTDGTGTSMSLANVTAPFGADTAQFDGTNDRIEFPLSLTATDDIFTVQGWGNPDDLSIDHRILSLGTANNAASVAVIWMDADGTGDGWRAQVKTSGATVITIGLDTDNDAAAATWQLLHHRLSLTDSELYLDGASKATGGGGGFSDGTGDADALIIGNIWRLTGSGAYFDGGISEVRLRMDNAVNDDWITTENANHSDPATFSTAGTPEAVGGVTRRYSLSLTGAG